MPLLRVASYNIHRAIGTDRRRDPHRIGQVIGELGAEIIGLQEVDWHDDDADWQLAYLAHIPGYQSVTGPNIRHHRGHYGNLLLSRLPVITSRLIDLTSTGREPRGAIDVDLDCHGETLRVVITHFGLSLGERWRQAHTLRTILTQSADRPVVLLGDFNEWLPRSPTLRPLLRCCGATAALATFPARRPVAALDRILVRGLPAPRHSWVHASPLARQASDHLPIVAEIAAP